ncbi:hypothetical protein ACQ4PT_027589 [Festuca glaucescens]
MPGFLGRKSRYVRMDDVLPQEQEGVEDSGGGGVRVRGVARRYVFFCSVFASLNHVLLGYDVGVMSGCIIFIQKDLHINEVQQEVLVGCLSFISLLGSLAAGRTSDAIGRKWTIGLAAAIFQVGAAVMTLASSFVVLMAGRLLAGVGIGFGLMVAPVYISEISPAALRGSLASFPEIFISLGILLGYVSNLAFAGLPDHINWRVMLAAGILPSISIAFVLTVIPESPRWLVMQGRTSDARAVLLKVTETEEEAEERLGEIEQSARATAADKAVWRELMSPSPVVLRMLVAGLGVMFFQQATGIDALVYYSPTIFRDAGIASEGQLLAATVAVGLSKTVFIVIAIALVDNVGRKPLLYVSTIGITGCLATLAAALSLLARGMLPSGVAIALAILTVCGFVAFFSVGIGPVNMVFSSEIYPLRLRAQAVATGLAVNRLTSGAVAMSFLSICRAVSVAGAFTAFAAVSALSVVFVHMFVPETSGKSLEQIESLFVGDGGEVELCDGEHLLSPMSEKFCIISCPAHTWAFPPADEFVIACADGAQITKKAGDADVTLLDRSYLHAGQTVVSASDVGGQIGVVTSVTTFVDLIELNDSGEASKVVATGVPPSALRRVRVVSLGDYVVSGPWLGRVVEVSLDVYVVFDDGAMCRVTNAESKEHPWVKNPRCYRPQENPSFYPGMRVVSTAFSAFFRGARWIKGHMMKREGEEGTVVKVEMAGVLVLWIASAHHGIDQQLVEESAPPAYQNPDNLTFFCSDSCCFWAVGDHCFLREESSLTASATSGTHGLGDAGSDHHHQDEQPRTCLPQSSSSASGDEHDEPSSPSPTRIPPAAPPALIKKKERSTDRRQQRKTGGWHAAAWGTIYVPEPSRDHERGRAFPRYVVDATGDDAMDMGAAAAKASARRTGVVKSVNSKDHTVNVSWFTAASRLEDANSCKEPECDDTVSAYDLGRDPDHSIFYGDVVVRLLSDVSGSTTVEQPHAQCNKKQISPVADLSWVGHVVDLHHGHVQVKWGDGSMSTVLPHEITVANKEWPALAVGRPIAGSGSVVCQPSDVHLKARYHMHVAFMQARHWLCMQVTFVH